MPSLDLMERAGAGLARVVAAAAAGRGPVRVVVGKGNNGGDGLVAARLLREDGREVDVLAAAALGELRATPLANLERLPGEPPRSRSRPERLEGSGAVVDALLGTGLRGRAARAGGRRDRGDQRPGRAGGGLRRALGRERLERRGRGRGGAGAGHRHLPRRRSSASRGARARTTPGEVEVVEIGIPRGAPARRARPA